MAEKKDITEVPKAEEEDTPVQLTLLEVASIEVTPLVTPVVAIQTETLSESQENTARATSATACVNVASETADTEAFEEAVRFLEEMPYTAPSSPQLPRVIQEQLIRYPPCRLQGFNILNGVVVIDSDEETPQRSDVDDDTASPKHKIAKRDEPNE